MPNNTETPVNDNTIIEVTSHVNSAIYSIVNHAIDRAPAPIRA